MASKIGFLTFTQVVVMFLKTFKSPVVGDIWVILKGLANMQEDSIYPIYLRLVREWRWFFLETWKLVILKCNGVILSYSSRSKLKKKVCLILESAESILDFLKLCFNQDTRLGSPGHMRPIFHPHWILCVLWQNSIC